MSAHARIEFECRIGGILVIVGRLSEIHIDVEEGASVSGVRGSDLFLYGQSLIKEWSCVAILSQFFHRHGPLAQQIGAHACGGETIPLRVRKRIETLLGELKVPRCLGWISLNLDVADLELDKCESPAGAGEIGIDGEGAFIKLDVPAIRGKGTRKIAQAWRAGLTQFIAEVAIGSGGL